MRCARAHLHDNHPGPDDLQERLQQGAVVCVDVELQDVDVPEKFVATRRETLRLEQLRDDRLGSQRNGTCKDTSRRK